jgi:hypothetical protein
MFKLTDGTMFFPSRMQVGQIKHSVGLTLARPPDDVVEEFAAVVSVPLEYQFQYGLAENMQLEGGRHRSKLQSGLCGGDVDLRRGAASTPSAVVAISADGSGLRR